MTHAREPEQPVEEDNVDFEKVGPDTEVDESHADFDTEETNVKERNA